MTLPLLLAVACAPASLGPTAGADAMVRALPADSELVVAVDLAAVRASPAWEAAVERWIDAEAVGEAMIAWTGSPDGPDRVRAACGPRGCVALADGSLPPLEPLRMATAGATLGVTPRARGGDLRQAGRDLVLRELAPGKLVAGDRGAVRALAAAHAEGAARFDPAVLADAVPAGQVWTALVSPRAERFADVEIAAVSLALDADAPTGILRARARLVDAPAAARRAAELRAAYAAAAARFDLPAPDLVVSDRTVELAAPVDPDTLDRVLAALRPAAEATGAARASVGSAE